MTWQSQDQGKGEVHGVGSGSGARLFHDEVRVLDAVVLRRGIKIAEG